MKQFKYEVGSVTIFSRSIKGGQSLYMNYRIGRKRQKESLGLKLLDGKEHQVENDNAKTRAKAIADRKNDELQDCVSGTEIRKKVDRLLKFEDFYKSVLASEYADKSKRTRTNMEQAARLLLSMKPDLLVVQLSAELVERFNRFLLNVNLSGRGEGYCQNTRALFCRLISVYINQACQQGFLSIKPTLKGSLPSRAKRVPTHLDDQELEILAQTTAQNEEVRSAFLFSCETGLRFSDVIRLRHDAICEGVLTIYQKKTQEPLVIPLSETALSLIKNNAGCSELCFRLPSLQTVSRVLRAWTLSANINKKVTYHVSRHTFACRLVRASVPIQTISKLMGHTNIQTTMIYAQVDTAAKLEAINRLPSFMHKESTPPTFTLVG